MPPGYPRGPPTRDRAGDPHWYLLGTHPGLPRASRESLSLGCGVGVVRGGAPGGSPGDGYITRFLWLAEAAKDRWHCTTFSRWETKLHLTSSCLQIGRPDIGGFQRAPWGIHQGAPWVARGTRTRPRGGSLEVPPGDPPWIPRAPRETPRGTLGCSLGGVWGSVCGRVHPRKSPRVSQQSPNTFSSRRLHNRTVRVVLGSD